MRKVVAVVAICAAGAVLGTWLAVRESEAQAAAPAPVRIVGGLAMQRAILRSVVHRVGPSQGLILRLRVPPRTSFRLPWRGWRLDLRAHRPTIRSIWEQQVIATLFLAETQRRKLPWIGYVQSDGGGGFFRAGVRDLATGAPSNVALFDWLQRMRRVATAAGARVVELRVLRPGPVLLAATLRVTDPPLPQIRVGAARFVVPTACRRALWQVPGARGCARRGRLGAELGARHLRCLRQA